MSDPLPQVQQQQPVVVYPNSVNVQPQTQSQALSHSKESFGASFIVLAVIVVVSAAACFLSRLCNKRGQKHKEPKQDKSHKQKKGQGGPPYPIHPTFPPQHSRRKEMDMEFGFGPGGGGPGRQQPPKGNDIEFGFDKKSGRPKGGDIEMGFDKRFPSGKGPQHADMMRGVKPYPNGVMKGENNPHFNGGHWGGQ